MLHVGTSARSSGNPWAVWCASRVRYTCAITKRMHAVCDERGNYSFRCGVAAGQTKTLAREQETSSQRNSGNRLGPSKFVCMGYSCTQTVSTQRAQALSNLRRAPMTPRWFWGSRSGNDRNYACWWQNIETYAPHMHVCVQLLVSLFYFIMARASDPALEIQMWMATKIEGWSLHRMYICTFDVGLNFKYAFGSVLTSITCTHHISFCAISTDPNTNNKWWEYSWSIRWRVFSTYSTYLHVGCINELGIHV